MIPRVNRMKDNSKIAIAAIISGAALETAMVISALPIKKYKAELKNASKKLNGKIKSTVTRTALLGICGALTTAAGISLKHKKSETTDERESRVEAVGMKEKASDETVIKDEAVAVENIKEALSRRAFRQSGNVKPADMRIPLIRKYVHIADN